MNVTKDQWIQIAKVMVTAILVIVSILGYDLGIVTPRTQAYVNAVKSEAIGAQAALPRLVNVNTAAITQTTTFDAFEWYRGSTPFTTADIYYSIDQGTTNTTTLSLEVSPDGTNNYVSYTPKNAPGLTDGSANIVANNAEDASGYVSAPIHLRFFRVKATVTNSQTVTPTVKVFLR